MNESVQLLTVKWRIVCFDSTTGMILKSHAAKNALKTDTAAQSEGNGHTAMRSANREGSRVDRLIADLDRRVSQNRHDIDVQFHRLAELQAVVDRMQIAATRARSRSGDDE
jgi:hypothetical protein